jgi:tRNA pseudouridine55 synthase
MTDTGDVEGSVIEEKVVPEISQMQLQACLNAFVGEIEQVPPMYSALKMNGRKLFELAREGITVARKARNITIYAIECLDFTGNLLTLDVRCSKGTYIRTLAEDIGHKLGCGGTVKKLRRTAAGQFSLADAYVIEELQAMESDVAMQDIMIAVDQPLQGLPAMYISQFEADLVQQGQRIASQFSTEKQGMCRLYHNKQFLGLGEILMDDKIQPRKLFNLN